MVTFKKKVLIVGVVCLIPSYVMGSCSGQLHNNNLNATCNGQSAQLQLSSVSYELLKKNTNLKNIVLDGVDSIDDLRKKIFSILPQIERYNQGSVQRDNQLVLGIQEINRKLSAQNQSRAERKILLHKLSELKHEKYQIREENSRKLYKIYKQHKKETSYLVKQLKSSMEIRYKVKEELNYANRYNHRLKLFISNATNTFSSSLASSFENYTECIKKNDFLSHYTFSEIFQQRNINSGGFSSNGISAISQLPGFSSSGVSSSSLESCSNQFRSLRKRFTLYEVALNLFVNSDTGKRRVVHNFFNVYKGRQASENEVTRFIQEFNSFQKSDLFSLIQKIDALIRKF